MPRSRGLPAELQDLFLAPDPKRSLSVSLPPGRSIRGNEGEDERPALWVSDEPPDAALVRSFRAAHQKSSLYPLLLEDSPHSPGSPWDTGELLPGSMSAPHDHDPSELLSAWWYRITPDSDENPALIAPYSQSWPGLAEAGPLFEDPDRHADDTARNLLKSKPRLRLGLVAAERGSDALAAVGWQGPLNHENDTAMLSAVLRSWEDRFGLRVIGVGYDTLTCSVAAPPPGLAEAVLIAAEHLAFCPDNISQGSGSLVSYAQELVAAPVWTFWWD